RAWREGRSGGSPRLPSPSSPAAPCTRRSRRGAGTARSARGRAGRLPWPARRGASSWLAPIEVLARVGDETVELARDGAAGDAQRLRDFFVLHAVHEHAHRDGLRLLVEPGKDLLGNLALGNRIQAARPFVLHHL